MRIWATESSRHEESKWRLTGFSTAATVVLFLWMATISVFLTGYRHIYGGNHAYQLLLVQKLNDATLYPNDPLADTAFSYASVFWYVVAWLSRVLDLSIVLFLFFLINKFMFLWAGFRLARTLFPDSRYAPIVGMAMMATFPQLLFGDGYATDYTQQSSLAIAALILSIDAFLNKRWIIFALWIGLAVNLNLMFSIFGLTYIAASWLVQLRGSRLADLVTKPVAATLGGLLIGAPGIYLVRQATTHAEYDPLSVWKACELFYPYHFYPQTWEIPNQLLALLLAIGVIFVVYRFRTASPVGLHLVAWTGVASGWYLAASLNPLLIHWLPLLHLHPVRALVLWQLVTVIFLVSFITRIFEINGDKNNPKLIAIAYLTIIMLIFINEIPPSKLFLGVAAVCFVAGEIGRRILSRHTANSTALLLATLVIAFVSLYAVGHSFRSVMKGRNILSIERYPSIVIAEWARNNTPKEAVFLIPIAEQGGWQLFRHLSQRNVFTHAKDGTAWPYAPWFAGEWLERLEALDFFEILGLDQKTFRIGSWLHVWSRDEKNFIHVYDKVDDNRVEALKQRYGIDYWIARADVKTRFPKVYEHEGWKVLRVSKDTDSDLSEDAHTPSSVSSSPLVGGRGRGAVGGASGGASQP